MTLKLENSSLACKEFDLKFDNTVQSDSDSALIHRSLQGDKEAFARLVIHYQQSIYALLYRWVQDRLTAEEMTQEVFLNAYRNLASFRGEAKFSTWLTQIAINRCRDFSRKKVRQIHSSEETDINELATPSETENQLVNYEQAQSLRRALESLPTIYRETLHLRFLEEKSITEIAVILSESHSNVKMRIARGLAKLKDKWEKLKR